MNTLYKPSGRKVVVNDNSLEHALSIGWTKEDPTAVKAKSPKPKPSKKAE